MRVRLAHRAALLCGLLVTAPVATGATGVPRVELSGFGTLGAAVLDRRDILYGRATAADGADRDGSLELDSRFGLQLDVDIAPRWSATVQGVAREGTDGDPEATLEWGFVRWLASDAITLRVGRLAMPSFAVSDFREVGYANTAIRPPQDLYVANPVTRFDGADLNISGEHGDTLWSVQLAAGQARKRVFGDIDVDAESSAGLNVVLERGPVRLRLSQIRARLRASSGDLAALNDGIERATPFVPALAGIADDFAEEHADFRITVASLGLDFDRWFVDAEYAHRRVDSWVHDSDSWYLTGGWRLGALTPYAYLSAFDHVDAGEHDVELPDNALLAPLEVGLTRFNEDRSQSTTGIGLRWDFAPNLALKGQLERIRSEARGISFYDTIEGTQVDVDFGTATLFSLALDVVF